MNDNFNIYGYENEPRQDDSGRTYDYYEVNKEPVIAAAVEPEKTKEEKPSGRGMGNGKKFGLTITMALIFGLVAGVVFQGVNLVGSRVLDVGNSENSPTIDNVQMEPNSSGTTQAGNNSTNLTTGVSSGEYTVADIARNAMPSVVAITAISVQEIQSFWGGTQQYEGVGSGSGIIIGQNDEELLIATNNHVVADAKNLSVSFYGDEVDATALNSGSTYGQSASDIASEYAKNSVAAQIKGTDADNDLAVIAVRKEDVTAETMAEIKVAVLGDSDSLVVGEQVVAIGNALGYGQSVTSGWISALDRTIDSSETGAANGLIQTDAAINPGNSGGALLNMKGEVIGINSAKFADETVEGMGFAIPLTTAEPILDDLMSRETRNKVDEDKVGYLGITCLEVSAEVAQMYKIPTGVFVDEVQSGGGAAKAGVQAGDVIVQIEGMKISSYSDLTDQLQYYAVGETIEIVVARADRGEYKEQTLSVTLGSRPK